MTAAPPRTRWLGWNGRRLCWNIVAQAPMRFALCVDGVVFARYDAALGEQSFDCDFEFSPTGNDKLEFTLAIDDGARDIGAPWRVRSGAPADGGCDQWTQGPRFLAPLADTPQLPGRSLRELPRVAIVVPIFNAARSVRRCLEALARWTPASARWILVDDASTDPDIAPLLAEFASRRSTLVERHSRNRGYTHAVNSGIALAGDADVVLLNSDTEVGPRWLQSLQLAAYGDTAIGTVTAVSDNAGAFSVPELEQYCPIPARWSLPAAQRALLQQAGLRFPELPTGNGFCMFVKRALIAKIGVMDADAFPSGYGEENDFCQRGLRAGYRNVIAGHVLVRHERSASFGDARRAALGVRGMAILRQRYPNYEADVGAALYSFSRRVLDYRVRRTWLDRDARYATCAPRPRLLLIAGDDGSVSSAAPVDDLDFEIFVLRPEPPPELRDAGGNAVATVPPGDTPDNTIRALLVGAAIEFVSAPREGAFARRVLGLTDGLGIGAAGA